MPNQLLTALLALIIERFVGYPAWLQRTIRHPVQWMGALIAWAEARWNDHARFSPRQRVLLGGLTMLLLALLFGGLAWGLARILPFWVEALLASTLLAQKSLKEHVQAILTALPTAPDDDLGPARRALSMIVGRDTTDFDEGRIAHAAIESLAENASDGIIAPLFWLLLAGLPGIVLYKLVNTADSMIGHLDERHRHFGKVAARLDDVLNFIPARLTALLYALTAAILPSTPPVPLPAPSSPGLTRGSNAPIRLRRSQRTRAMDARLRGHDDKEGRTDALPSSPPPSPSSPRTRRLQRPRIQQRNPGWRSLITALRDARKHVSPNAGWPEAAMAGALHIRLGGPRSYAGRMVDFPWLGDGREELSRADLHAALALHERMLWLATALLALITGVVLLTD